MMNDVQYLKIDDLGIYIQVDHKVSCLNVDNIILCAGQVSNTSLYDEIKDLLPSVHLIGGADVASELDAKRAIRQGAVLASRT